MRKKYDSKDFFIVADSKNDSVSKFSWLTKEYFDKNKITKKYNFVPDAEANLKAIRIKEIPKRYVVFYGRIGEEKGTQRAVLCFVRLRN